MDVVSGDSSVTGELIAMRVGSGGFIVVMATEPTVSGDPERK